MLEAAGQRELAMALALLGVGVLSGTWIVLMADLHSPKAGTFAISGGAGNVRVFLVAGSDAAVRLWLDGNVSGEDDDVVVVQSSDPVPQMPRAPTRSRGRKGRSGPRIVGIPALLRNAEDAAQLMQRFREEVAM